MPPSVSPPLSSVGVGYFDRSDRVRVEVIGPDRAKLLHNLTTNDVKRLAVGRGFEAFVTSPQGKTIGYVLLHAAEDRILVRTDPGGMLLALPHLRKYGMFDDVGIEDRSEATFEFHLAGRHVEGLLLRSGAAVPGLPEYSHATVEVAGRPVLVIRESPAGFPGFTLIGGRGDLDDVIAALKASVQDGPLVEPGPFALEAMRIEAGTPVFGQDVTEKNLPQEFLRDDRAISFVKGCYLGQETVARIDALGHVNQVLKGLILEPGTACPPPGAVLEADGKRVGAITSSADSPWRGHPVALGMIRTSHAAAGTAVLVAGVGDTGPGVATIRDLPMIDPP